MPVIKDLVGFVDKATNSRKYNPNTAGGYKSALSLFETELNEEEDSKLEVFIERFDAIYQQVFDKNLGDYSASSLSAYRRRVLKVVKDYKKYAGSPEQFTSWKPAVRVSKKKIDKQEKELEGKGGSSKGVESSPSKKGLEEEVFAQEKGHYTVSTTMRYGNFGLKVPYKLDPEDVLFIEPQITLLNNLVKKYESDGEDD